MNVRGRSLLGALRYNANYENFQREFSCFEKTASSLQFKKIKHTSTCTHTHTTSVGHKIRFVLWSLAGVYWQHSPIHHPVPIATISPSNQHYFPCTITNSLKFLTFPSFFSVKGKVASCCWLPCIGFPLFPLIGLEENFSLKVLFSLLYVGSNKTRTEEPLRG